MSYCPKCGYKFEGVSICPQCGYDMRTRIRRPPQQTEVLYPQPPQPQYVPPQPQRAFSREDEIRSLREALVAKKTEHYVPIFEDLDKEGGASWNWCGFLVSACWFAYRKVYAWAAIAIAGPLVAGFIMGFILYSSIPYISDAAVNGMSIILGFACMIVFGVLANRMYKIRVDKLIQEMPADPMQRQQYIRKHGGVSVPATMIAIVISVVVSVGSSLLIMGL